MMIIQLTGLSGSGKSTLADIVSKQLRNINKEVEVLDGDQLRKTLNRDLGFSKQDREENIRRLGALAHMHVLEKKIVIIAAINPYENIRKELNYKYGAKVVWLFCPVETLKKRDTKGLYARALLPDGHPDKISNLTGINDIYEEPLFADLTIDTEKNSIERSSVLLLEFIIGCFQ